MEDFQNILKVFCRLKPLDCFVLRLGQKLFAQKNPILISCVNHFHSLKNRVSKNS